jgi:GNAT superfamily N-acetyltransferase
MHTFDLRDNENANIGNAMRVYRHHPTRGLEADHESLYLTPEAQGQGIGNELAQKAEQFYRDHGIGHIRLHAAGTLGRYVWARHGYDFDPTDYPKEGPQFTTDYLEYLREKGQHAAYDELARRVDQRGAPLHSWEIALHDASPDFRPATIVKDVYNQPGKDFGFMTRGHSGKIFLLSHHGWRGIKHLDGGIGDQIGRQYMEDIDRRHREAQLAKSRTNPKALDAHLDDRAWHDHALDNGWEAASLHRQRLLLARLMAEEGEE